MIDFSEAGTKFFAAFVAAQGEMDNAKTDATNPAFSRAGKGGRYATLTAVIDAIEPILNKHGIGVLQSIGDTDASGFLEVETILLHGASGERVSSIMRVKVSRLDAQGQGSAATYGRRYTLSALCGLAVEDDDGNIAAGSKNKTQREKTVRELLSDRLKEDDIPAFDVARVMGNCTYSELSDKFIAEGVFRYDELIEAYKEKKAKIDAANNEEIPMPEAES